MFINLTTGKRRKIQEKRKKERRKYRKKEVGERRRGRDEGGGSKEEKGMGKEGKTQLDSIQLSFLYIPHK